MKTKFFYGIAALATIGLSACSSEDLGGYDPGKAEVDQTQYLSISISAPKSGTRTFEDGTANESKVTRLDFLFYDNAGNPTSAPYATNKAGLDGEFTPDSDPNVTKFWTSVVPVVLTQGQNLPAQVVCLVNANANSVQNIASQPLSALRDIERDYFNNGNDFLMSNSVYFGLNTITGESDARLCATPINPGQLFPTEEEAKAATGQGLVNIYVERVAAKVGLTMDANAPKTYSLANGDVPGGDDVTLTYVPEYWFMNATARTNYVTKRYGVQENGNIIMTPSFDQIQGVFDKSKGWKNWNDPTNHRSYWGCSPSYYINNYPMVSDDVNDLVETPDPDKYNEKYYSYTEVEAQAVSSTIAKQAIAAQNSAFTISNTGEIATGYIYTPETTATIGSINDVAKNPAAVVGSAVIIGKYTVTGATSEADGTFYVDRNLGAHGTYYGSKESAKTHLANRQGIVFRNTATDGQAANYVAVTDADIFTLSHPVKAVRDELANGNLAGRLVTLQLTAAPSPALYYFDLEANEYTSITADNLTKVNALLCGNGYLDMFKKGIAFFNIPIRHLGFDEATCLQEKNGVMVYNWAAMRLGDLGIVRNHVYTVNVRTIEGLGTGVRSENQPIVPPVDQLNQWVAVRLNILAWNVVNAWNVDL